MTAPQQQAWRHKHQQAWHHKQQTVPRRPLMALQLLVQVQVLAPVAQTFHLLPARAVFVTSTSLTPPHPTAATLSSRPPPTSPAPLLPLVTKRDLAQETLLTLPSVAAQPWRCWRLQACLLLSTKTVTDDAQHHIIYIHHPRILIYQTCQSQNSSVHNCVHKPNPTPALLGLVSSSAPHDDDDEADASVVVGSASCGSEVWQC